MRSLVLLAALGIPLATTHAQSAGNAPPRPPVYFDFQVDSGAQLIVGTANPKYPEAHKAAKVEGDLLVQFVVDTAGMVELTTFKVLKFADSLFVQSVRDALPDMRFFPAYAGGKKVKQLVQLPFVFNVKEK